MPEPLLSRFACFEMTAPPVRRSSDLLAPATRALAADLGLSEAMLRDLLTPAIANGVALPPNPTLRAAKGALRAALGAHLRAATFH